MTAGKRAPLSRKPFDQTLVTEPDSTSINEKRLSKQDAKSVVAGRKSHNMLDDYN